MSEEFYCEIETNFTMIPNEIWDYNLNPYELAVLYRIFRRAGAKSGSCFESRKHIAAACKMSTKQVDRVFTELELHNIIEIDSRKDAGRPNLIRIKAIAHWLSKRTNSPKGEGGCDSQSHRGETDSPTGCDSQSHHISISSKQTQSEGRPNLVAAGQARRHPPQKTAGTEVWQAYSEAYATRYGQEPLRNAKVNTVCSQIANQVGVEVGQAVMHFYLQQNVAWYVQKAHAIEYALKDLQALRTNMLNNQAMSSRQAQLVDKQQSQKNALDNYLANREKYAFK